MISRLLRLQDMKTRAGNMAEIQPSETCLVSPAFVLVRPQMGENIGAAARAMWNFGLDRMRIVAPRDGWPNEKATALASGAGRLLDSAQLSDDFTSAIGECTYVLATTARPRGLTKPVLSPEEAMRRAAEKVNQGERVAVVFGPERAGLENDEIARCNAIVSVPVNPDFPSLNLAQCVLLLAYEWRRQTANVLAEDLPLAKTEWAEMNDITALGDHFEAQLEEAGFFFPKDKAASMKVNLRNLWSRLPLTKSDARMLHGILRQMVRWAKRSS